MVGGGRDAFIGAVHRHAMALDGQIELVAGALSSQPDKALRLGPRPRPARRPQPRLAGRRCSTHELQLPAEERIDFVTIVTPNHVHYEVARAFAEAGIHVVCDKPLVHTSAQADDAGAASRAARHRVRASPTTTCGYPMVRAGARDGARRRDRRDPQGDRRVPPGLARHAGGEPAATSRPTGAPTRRAAASPAPWATSARMPRTWCAP